MASFSLFKESAKGLVGKVRGLETVYIQTGEEMTKEQLLLSLHHKHFVGMLLFQFVHHLVETVVQLPHLLVKDVPRAGNVLEDGHVTASTTMIKNRHLLW